MSFSPLPGTFLEDLRERSRGRVVELGCGDGVFSSVLSDLSAHPLRLDRRSPRAGSVADLVADARRLPLRRGSVDMLVCANLLRHLWPVQDGAAVPPDWRGSLGPNGILWILEDEPAGRPPAARLYRDLQAFLAQLDPASRRPLLAQDRFVRRLREDRQPGGQWRLGRGWNAWPVDTVAVKDLLRRLADDSQGPARELLIRVERFGLSYGPYWWACWTATDQRR
jgi:SAM-dependent methyltransferase